MPLENTKRLKGRSLLWNAAELQGLQLAGSVLQNMEDLGRKQASWGLEPLRRVRKVQADNRTIWNPEKGPPPRTPIPRMKDRTRVKDTEKQGRESAKSVKTWSSGQNSRIWLSAFLIQGLQRDWPGQEVRSVRVPPGPARNYLSWASSIKRGFKITSKNGMEDFNLGLTRQLTVAG